METVRDTLLRNATETVRRGGSASLNFRDLGRSAGVEVLVGALLLSDQGGLAERNRRRPIGRAFIVRAERRWAARRRCSRQEDAGRSWTSSGMRRESGSPASAACWPPRPRLLDPKVRGAVNLFFRDVAALGRRACRRAWQIMQTRRADAGHFRQAAECRCSKGRCFSVVWMRTSPASPQRGNGCRRPVSFCWLSLSIY